MSGVPQSTTVKYRERRGIKYETQLIKAQHFLSQVSSLYLYKEPQTQKNQRITHHKPQARYTKHQKTQPMTSTPKPPLKPQWMIKNVDKIKREH